MEIFNKKLKINIPQKHRDVLIFSLLIIIALGIRVFMFSISDNGWGADPDERMRVTANWLSLEGHRPMFPGDLWLPLHYYLIALSIILFKSIPLGPRALHLIFGVLTVFPFYKLVKLVFNNRIAIISTLLFIFFPIHILCSIVTLSEGPFLFFLVISIYFFFKYREKQNSKSLLLSCIFLILSSMIRYEGWLFIVVIPILLFIDKKFKEGLIFLCASSIFPFLWISSTMLQPLVKSIMNIFHWMSPETVTLQGHFSNLFYWFKVIINYFSLPLAIFLIFGLYSSIKHKNKAYLMIISLSLLLFFTFGVLSATVLKNIEYSLSFSVLLIPFAVFGFDRLLNIRLFRNLLIPIFLGFVILCMISNTLKIIDSSRYKDYVKDVANYLKHNAGEDSKILLNNYHYQSNHIPIYIGTGIDRFSISGYGGDYELRTKENMMKYIIDERPKYIVYSDESELKSLFNEKYLLNSEFGIFLNLVFESGPYKIYNISYLDG